MAIEQRVRIEFQPRSDRLIHASSAAFGEREFEWSDPLKPSAAGDWVNYVKAAAQAVSGKWGTLRGIDAEVNSDLPPAAGLSSSSALLAGFTLALLRANGIQATFEELMGVLPEGEYFVGTRGGGMDHAAVLAAQPGCALLIRFAPVSIESVPVPKGWAFLAAHSLTTAEKSGEVRAMYNARRTEGTRAVERLGFASYRDALARHSSDELIQMGEGRLTGEERERFLHVVGEAARVDQALAAMRAGDAAGFGRLLTASHQSLRDLLEVSCPALDELVETALSAGALGARLTGAGFGGFAVIACHAANRDQIAEEIVRRFYLKRDGFIRSQHLIFAEPSAGALHA